MFAFAPLTSGAMNDFALYAVEQFKCRYLYSMQPFTIPNSCFLFRSSPLSKLPRLLRAVSENLIPLHLIDIHLTSPRIRLEPLLVLNGIERPSTIFTIIYWRIIRRSPCYIFIHDPVPHRGNTIEIILAAFGQLARALSQRHYFLSSYYHGLARCSKARYLPLQPSSRAISNCLKATDGKSVKKDVCTIQFLGRLEPYKGLVEFLLLLETLYVQRKIPSGNILLKINGAGSSIYTKKLLSVYNALDSGLREIVNLQISHLDEMNLYLHIANSDCLLMPYTDYSQSLLPRFASLLAKPVLCTELPALISDLDYLRLPYYSFRSTESVSLELALRSLYERFKDLRDSSCVV